MHTCLHTRTGWQFSIEGECTKLPQLDVKYENKIPSALSAQSLPTYITGDVLFAFIPLPEGQASYYPRIQDEVLPILRNVSTIASRELPYSFDYLIENFMVKTIIKISYIPRYFLVLFI